MTIEVNNVFPNQDLRLIVDGELKQVNSSEYLADKKIILVGVPGAFTPTCHESHLPGYVDNISKFKEKTGCPLVVNTSFNVRGEPIICTPIDAFKCFMGTELDMLAVGNFLLTKDEQDGALKENYAALYELD